MAVPVMVSFRGETLSQTNWGKRLGMRNPGRVISKRLAKGWPIDRVLATDLPRYPRKHGSESPVWKGGRVRMGPDNYIGVFLPGHPRANGAGYVREHILVAEKALGKPLPVGAIVHHIDENQAANVNGNLVICQDIAYHHLIHVRTRIVKAGGHPDLHKICSACHQARPRTEFTKLRRVPDGLGSYCMECRMGRDV